MSSRVSSGKSSRISASDMPAAQFFCRVNSDAAFSTFRLGMQDPGSANEETAFCVCFFPSRNLSEGFYLADDPFRGLDFLQYPTLRKVMEAVIVVSS